MKTKSSKVLPKTADEITNGGVHVQRVRCGKSNCRCSRGGEAHSSYYFFTRRNGKLVKSYIRKADVTAFIEMVETATFQRKQKSNAVKSSMRLLAKLRSDLLNNDGIIKSLK